MLTFRRLFLIYILEASFQGAMLRIRTSLMESIFHLARQEKFWKQEKEVFQDPVKKFYVLQSVSPTRRQKTSYIGRLYL